MKLEEYAFTEYYGQYVTIEADDLTELLSDAIEVHEDDCYALCSSYCAPDGMLEFNVLSIGPSWEDCLRGIENPEMLGYFTMDQVYDREMRIAEPAIVMIAKNAPFLMERNCGIDEDVLFSRTDSRLDDLRDLCFPDIVLAGVITDDHTLREFDMRITGMRGPFLIGRMEEEPLEDIGIHEDDPLWTLPYVADGTFRLFVLFGGSELSEEEIKARDMIITETDRAGLSFAGLSIRS